MSEQPSFIDVWKWTEDFHSDALRKGDRARAQLRPLYLATTQLMEASPDEAISRLQEARLLAQTLNEPYWECFFEYWICSVMIWNKREVNAGLDRAVRLAVRANASEYRRWPFNPRAQFIVLGVYKLLDPLSYRDEISNGIAYIESELNFDQEVWRLIPKYQQDMCYIAGQHEEELKYIYHFLERSQGNNFQLCSAHSLLCKEHFKAKRYQALMETAREGEAAAHKLTNRRHTQICLRLWWAIAAHAVGDKNAAREQYRAALQIKQSLGSAFRFDRADVFTVYYEFTEALDSALTCYRDIVDCTRDSGSPFLEYEARVFLCRMLKIMGLLTQEEIDATRGAQNRLKYPERYPAYLERIIAGDTAYLF
jgi:hypothetical protein